ncbi:MAG: tyrosine-type recombinase/integrase [Gammaproteobacteria bacterium]|nr:tyrosine-type recombinase/integrase [Gammaproteobacteria bacterium]
MSQPRAFTNWLAPHFDGFVALKRASGADYALQKGLLLAFDRYLEANATQPPLLRETVMQYIASLDRLTPRSRDNVVSVLWPSLSYAVRHGANVEPLLARPPKPSRHHRQRQPRLVTITETRSLLAGAREYPPQNILRPVTTATLIGLLYTTGIRIGEALALDVGDLDTKDRILNIRKGKFGKSRSLPLLESTAEALVCYLEHPLRPLGTQTSAPFFVSGRRRRLSYPTASGAIYDVCRIAEISKPWPRPHDLRHTFALSRVESWYREGRDVNSLLPLLSTYLGHVSVENTRRYLIANGVLLEQAGARFEDHTRALDEVLS